MRLCVVLSGGGQRAAMHFGALHVLAAGGALPACDAIVGASAGALVGLLLIASKMRPACGFALAAGLLDTTTPWWSRMVRPAIDQATGAPSLLDWDAVDAGLRPVLDRAGLAPDLTLGELRSRTGVGLWVALFDLALGRAVLVGPDTHPDTPVLSAVRGSCAFPLLFPPHAVPGVGDCIDGGLLCSCPLAAARDGSERPTASLRSGSRAPRCRCPRRPAPRRRPSGPRATSRTSRGCWRAPTLRGATRPPPPA